LETVRYYERIGLMPKPSRTASNYRNYEPEHVERLSFIRRAREIGFSIGEIKELLLGSRAISRGRLPKLRRLRSLDPERKFDRRDPHSRADIRSSGRALP